jgi:hypothetical protein
VQIGSIVINSNIPYNWHIFMVNNFYPPAFIIFLNDNVVAQIQGVFSRQFYLTQIMSAAVFDGYVAAQGFDGYGNSIFAQNIHADGYRIMVLRNYQDLTNRNLADIVLYSQNGLVSILFNKYGPPAGTFGIDRCYLSQLISVQKIPPRPPRFPGFPNIYDLFKGHPYEAYDRNYDPNKKDPPISPEPRDE